jgi:hypothetical protein
MADLIQSGSGRVIRVPDDRADVWRARGYRDVNPNPTETGLSGMTKAQLLEHADANSIEVTRSATKAEIVAAIEAH